MPFTLDVHRIRLQCDYAEPGAVLNRLTGAAVRIPKASEVRFEIGIFAGLNGQRPTAAAQVASTSGWSTLTLTLQRTLGVNILSKSTSSFTSLTADTWNDDSAQHASIILTETETDISLGKYLLGVTLETATLRFPAGTATAFVF